jgi:hypothetical protein
MSQRKVKGALIAPLAMMINHRKDLDWKQGTELTDQDLKRVKEGILPSVWYDLEFLERVVKAVTKVIANDDPKLIFEFGKSLMAQTMLKTYRAPLARKDPGELLARAVSLFSGMLFNSVQAELQPLERGWLFRLSDPEGLPIQKMLVPAFRGVLVGVIQVYQLGEFQVDCEEESSLASKTLTSATFRIIRKEG